MIKHQIKGKFQVQKVTDLVLDNSKDWVAKTRNYSEKIILKTIFKTAIDKSSLESSVNKLQIKTEGYGSIPSVDTILRAINRKYDDLTPEMLETRVSSNLQLLAAMVLKNSNNKADIAIDIHNEEFYGDSMTTNYDDREYIMYNETGSRKVFKYATLTVVSYGYYFTKPLTVGFAMVWKGMKRVDIINKLLRQIEPLQIRLNWVLMDGGFSGVECVKFLLDKKLKFITRGKYSKKKQYLDSIGLSFEYELKNAESSIKIEGMLIREKTKKGKRKFIFFLCSKPMTHCKLKQLYRQRFRIENTYRHQRKVKIRTCSRKLHVRWFLWVISILIELIWEICAHIYDVSGLDKYSSRQEMINSHILDHIQDNLAKARYRLY